MDDCSVCLCVVKEIYRSTNALFQRAHNLYCSFVKQYWNWSQSSFDDVTEIRYYIASPLRPSQLIDLWILCILNQSSYECLAFNVNVSVLCMVYICIYIDILDGSFQKMLILKACSIVYKTQKRRTHYTTSNSSEHSIIIKSLVSLLSNQKMDNLLK